MAVELLDSERVARLRTGRLTYPEVGATPGELRRGGTARRAWIPAVSRAERSACRWRGCERRVRVAAREVAGTLTSAGRR